MKKRCIIVVIIVVIFGIGFLRADEKYHEVKQLLHGQAGAFKTLIKAESSIKDAPTAAAVLNRFAADMRKLLPLASIAVKKYPNMEEMFIINPPEELKEEMTELSKLAAQMITTMNKIMEYAQDPAVKKALKGISDLKAETKKILQEPHRIKK